MKRVFIALLFFMAVCIPAGAQTVTGDISLVCNALEERGGMLHLEMDIRIRKECIPRGHRLSIEPIVTNYSSNAKIFPNVTVTGNFKRKQSRRYKKHMGSEGVESSYGIINAVGATDTVLRYMMEIPYEKWMDDSYLVIRQVFSPYKGGQRILTVNMEQKVTHRHKEPYAANPAFTFVEPDREAVKNRNLNAQAFLAFRSGRTEIDPLYGDNYPELSRISETIAVVRDNPDADITGIYITGYASPEGKYDANLRLAKKRGHSLAGFIRDEMGVAGDIIHVYSGGEDWAGLRQMVQGSGIYGREGILSLIDSDISPDSKKEHLKRYSSYHVISAEMMPRLRRSEYRIDYTVRNYSPGESSGVISRDPSLLSHWELYNLANTYETGSPEFFEIYEIIERYYSDDLAGAINTATVAYLRGDHTLAKQKLEALMAQSPHAKNNLGAIYLSGGELEKAEQLLIEAQDTGSADAAHNLREIENLRVQGDKKRLL